MRKHDQIHTLGTPHKAHFQFLKKLKDFKCSLWSKHMVFGENLQKQCASQVTPQPWQLGKATISGKYS